MKWQPIETCPPGQEVLVYGRSVDDPSTPKVWITSGVTDGVCYVDDGYVTGDMAEVRATHWMPLPDPPSERG